MRRQTWQLEDHLCRGCGGRILKCVSGQGPSPGGNPLWKCADCGDAKAASSPSSLCWCGFGHRLNTHDTAYRCVSFSVLTERPELKDAFLACGCDPTRGEVGIMLERDWLSQSRLREKPAAAPTAQRTPAPSGSPLSAGAGTLRGGR